MLILAAFVGFGLHQVIEPWLIATACSVGSPQWFVTPIAMRHGRRVLSRRMGGHAGRFPSRSTDSSARSSRSSTSAATCCRGWNGWAAGRRSSTSRLFSLYHFWSPWQIVARILGFAPTVYAVRWKRNIYLGMIVHCSLNSIAVVLVAMMVFSRL